MHSLPGDWINEGAMVLKVYHPTVARAYGQASLRKDALTKLIVLFLYVNHELQFLDINMYLLCRSDLTMTLMKQTT